MSNCNKKKGSIEDSLILRLENLELETNKNEPKSSFVKHCLELLINIQTTLLKLCANSKG